MMKMKYFLTLLTLFLVVTTLHAQENVFSPDLSKVKNNKIWQLHNRKVSIDKGVNLNAQPGDGILRLIDFSMGNGKIELEIKGENAPGQSFVGLAFQVQNDSTFDAIYFRPFNFKNPDRNNHSVQYISHPRYTWSRLREESPGKYENTISPVPNPDDWFKATILIDYPNVKVYVNDSETPSLDINQISKKIEGSVGFWVGNNSKGSFRNLRITKIN